MENGEALSLGNGKEQTLRHESQPRRDWRPEDAPAEEGLESKLAALWGQVQDYSRDCLHRMEGEMRRHPKQVLWMSFGVGLFLGALWTRRK